MAALRHRRGIAGPTAEHRCGTHLCRNGTNVASRLASPTLRQILTVLPSSRAALDGAEAHRRALLVGRQEARTVEPAVKRLALGGQRRDRIAVGDQPHGPTMLSPQPAAEPRKHLLDQGQERQPPEGAILDDCDTSFSDE